jgi:hypothetical protein
MVSANIDNFEMPCEESASYFKQLENFKKIKYTNGPGTAKLQIESNKSKISVTSSLCNSSKNTKSSNMWCHYYDKNNRNTADCKEIAKFKQPTLKLNLDPERSL